MKIFYEIQSFLEETYGAKTGLDVRDFIRPVAGLDNLGQLWVDQTQNGDLDVAVLLDRDILAAWEKPQDLSPRALSVSFEEISHFVYLAYNHERKRNITRLELEAQSEVDRILLAFHKTHEAHPHGGENLLNELVAIPYSDQAGSTYEEARELASKFIRNLSGGDPRTWTPTEFEILRKFFHSDLSEKIHLARGKKL